MSKEIHHYMIEIDSDEKKLVEKIRDELSKLGCIEKYSGDMGVYYAQFFMCKSAMVIVGFSGAYFIDILSEVSNIEPYIRALTSAFSRDKVMIHYVIRSI